MEPVPTSYNASEPPPAGRIVACVARGPTGAPQRSLTADGSRGGWTEGTGTTSGLAVGWVGRGDGGSAAPEPA